MKKLSPNTGQLSQHSRERRATRLSPAANAAYITNGFFQKPRNQTNNRIHTNHNIKTN